MAERKKGFEIFIEENISEHNVMRMGELLALNALRVMCRYENFHGMYADIVRDIQYKDLEGYILTDSYDLAQEAAMFLCGYIGKNVYDTCIETKSGKTYTIRRLCSKVVCHKIYEILKIRKNTERAEELHKSIEPYVLLEEKKETDYTKYDEILSKLNLTKEEKETIDGYMAGISVTQQARLFNVYNSTIWRRRKRVQDKYLAIEVTLLK